MVNKSQYYAQLNGLDPADCAPVDNGAGPQLIGPHAAAILAIADDDPGFVAWQMDRAKTALTAAIQRHLDATAQTRQYDGILSLCSYATSTDPIFSTEGQAGVVFRDACWRKGEDVMEAVLQGQRAIPTEAELLAEMPVIGW